MQLTQLVENYLGLRGWKKPIATIHELDDDEGLETDFNGTEDNIPSIVMRMSTRVFCLVGGERMLIKDRRGSVNHRSPQVLPANHIKRFRKDGRVDWKSANESFRRSAGVIVDGGKSRDRLLTEAFHILGFIPFSWLVQDDAQLALKMRNLEDALLDAVNEYVKPFAENELKDCATRDEPCACGSHRVKSHEVNDDDPEADVHEHFYCDDCGEAR